MKPIPLARPWLFDEETQAVGEVLSSGWVTQGPRVAQFEKAVAEHVNAAHACGVSSCTSALHLALLAVGVRPGDVVLTVSMSFIASANAVRMCQAEPVFVDVEPGTLNISPSALEKTLLDDFRHGDDGLWYRHADRLATRESPLSWVKPPIGRLGAILVVHQLGMPADLPNLLGIARRHSVPIVEDAACALGTEVAFNGNSAWEKIGRPHGDVACFSFHPRKLLTTGDGGMLTTASAKYDSCFRLLRHHGMSVTDMQRHQADGVVLEEYVSGGFNYRMTDLQAAVGNVQMGRLSEIVDRRRVLAARYQEKLADVNGVALVREPHWARSNWQSIQIQLDRQEWQLPVMTALKQRGVATRRGVMCAHLETPYRSAWPEGSLPVSEDTYRRGVTLPLFPAMTEDMVDYVAACLKESLHAFKEPTRPKRVA